MRRIIVKATVQGVPDESGTPCAQSAPGSQGTQRATAASKLRYKVVYDKPGRLRVRMGQNAFSPEQGYGIEALLISDPLILSVETTSVNGGILIHYVHDVRDVQAVRDAQEPTAREHVIKLIESLDRNNLPESKALDINHTRELDDAFLRSLAYLVGRHYVIKLLLPAPLRALITVYNAMYFWKKGLRSLSNKKVNVDVLDASAIFASIAQGSFSTASSIIMLLRISEILENYTRKRAKQSLAQSLVLNIDCVWLLRGEESVLTPVSQVRIGDVIRIHTGTVIPLDGEVASGEALVNESSMTGEPHGVMRSAGNTVFAGTVVEEGSIDVRVKTLADDNRIQKIISLIDSSEDLKAEIQGKAERLADSIVPFNFLAAAATLLLTGNATRAISVLMADYSCAIKLTTPICIITTMHEASKRRILVKGGRYLEAYAGADTVVFDKTGTLTTACPSVAKVIPFGGLERGEALKIAACLEEHFPHSVAKAIVRQAEVENLKHREEHAQPEYIVAHGISSKLNGKRALIGSWHFITEDEGTLVTDDEKAIIDAESDGFSAIFLALDGRLAGMICIDDPVRPEAAEVLDELRALGLKEIIMLTGDRESAAKTAAAELGITSYYAGVLPEGKSEIVQKMREEGRTVIMVGDGINDSPALVQADVSVAMKDGSDIAKEVADITLLSENLNGLVTLRRMSCELIDKIQSNYRHIVGFNTGLLLLGAAGIILPSTSAILHNASTMLLCGLSMRRKP